MRTQRQWSESDIYHVVCRGTARQLIFEDDSDRLAFLELLSNTLHRDHVELLAWCLMDNHIHLLMCAPLPSISNAMRRLCGSYAQRFNRKTGRVGHLFQERFKSEPVENDSYLLTVVRYIHQNPLKAGIASMQDYRWSSYHEYLNGHGICTTQLVLGAFGDLESFVSFHEVEDSSASCLDVTSGRNRTRAMPEETARAIADEVLGADTLQGLKELPSAERNEKLRLLKSHGLTVRQIERMTGIGRNTVSRA